MEKESRKKGLKPWKEIGFFRKVWRIVWISILGLWGLSLFLVLLYRFINPPLTPLMIQRFFQQVVEPDRKVNFERDYVKLEDISPNLVTAVVYSEDGLFMYHHGFDVKQLKNSYRENKRGRRVRGGSTISMQTAKNAFLPHRRSYLRKACEAYFTILIEKVWGKERIMEVYLNVIEFGDGIYGCEAASQHYYGHSAKNLTRREAAQLAVTLPSPLKRNPAHKTSFFRSQTNVVMGRMGWGRVCVDPDKMRPNKKYQNQETIWDFVKWLWEEKKKEK